MNLYEAMFLLDPTFGASMENCESEIKRLLGRAEAEVVFIGKWDERRLAYERAKSEHLQAEAKYRNQITQNDEHDSQRSNRISGCVVLGANSGHRAVGSN